MKIAIERSFKRNCYAVYLSSDDGGSIVKPECIEFTEHSKYCKREPSFTVKTEDMDYALSQVVPEDKLTKKELELTRNHLKDIQYLTIEKDRRGV